MSEQLNLKEAMTKDVNFDMKRKGENTTVIFNSKKTMRIGNEQITLKQGYDRYLSPFIDSHSPTITAIRLIALAKRATEFESAQKLKAEIAKATQAQTPQTTNTTPQQTPAKKK